MIVLALVLVRYLSMVVELPTRITMLGTFLLVLLANLFGVGIAAGVQKVLMGALVLLFVIFALWGSKEIFLFWGPRAEESCASAGPFGSRSL